MGITLDQSEESSLIHLEGSIDVACAAELKKLLLVAIESGSEVRVSLEGATYLDVTAIQLLWAAEREAGRSGLEFALAGQVPGPVSAALLCAGFEKFPIPADKGQVSEVIGCQA